MSVTVAAGETRPLAAGARSVRSNEEGIMDPKRAWTKMFEMYTDGDNVWAMKDGEMVASARIGQDIDGPDVAMQTAAREVAEQAAGAVGEYMLVVR